MKIQWKTAQKGETLIEALGALALIAIVVTAVANVVIASIANTQYNENQTLATKYAQEGIEAIRQIRNQNYTAFRSADGLYCFGKGQTTLGNVQSSCTAENADTFIRTIEIDHTPGCSPNVARVTVSVSFKDGKCTNGTYCHTQTHSSCLSTVNPVQGL